MLHYTDKQVAQMALQTINPEYDDITIANYINDNISSKKIANEKNVNKYLNSYINLRIDKWLDKYYENSFAYYSIFAWSGDYWNNGEKKLEFICQLEINTTNGIEIFKQLIDKIKKHNLKPYNRDFEYCAFDLESGLKNELISKYLNFKF